MNFFSIITTAIVVVTPLLYAGSQTHCSKQEEVIFSCNTGKKTVSVCGKQKTLTYEFGAIGKSELKIKVKNPTGDTLMFSGGGGAYLRLPNGGYNYVLYIGSGREWEKEGLVLEKNGRLINFFECKDSAITAIGMDTFNKYSIPTDNGFEIP